jgi:ERF superfamily
MSELTGSSIYSALSKAQAEIKPPKKDKTVNFNSGGRQIRYSYASLSDIIECLRKPFANHGLSFSQTINPHSDGVYLTTSIFHSSGDTPITSVMPLPDPTTMKPQDFASILTYFKRYSLASLAGVESEEDDDGQLPRPRKRNLGPKQANQPLKPSYPYRPLTSLNT